MQPAPVSGADQVKDIPLLDPPFFVALGLGEKVINRGYGVIHRRRPVVHRELTDSRWC